jgi:hypothetical protein
VSREPNSLKRDRPAVRGVRSVDVVCVFVFVFVWAWVWAVGEKRTHSSDSSRRRFSCCAVVATCGAASGAW